MFWFHFVFPVARKIRQRWNSVLKYIHSDTWVGFQSTLCTQCWLYRDCSMCPTIWVFHSTMVFECSSIFYTCDVWSDLMDVFQDQIPHLANLTCNWKTKWNLWSETRWNLLFNIWKFLQYPNTVELENSHVKNYAEEIKILDRHQPCNRRWWRYRPLLEKSPPQK